MSDKPEYEILEIDYFPIKDSEKMIQDFLQALRILFNTYNKSSDLDTEGGAGFYWHITIEAKGKWA